MYEYTETESKHTGKIKDTQQVGTNVHNTLQLKIMMSEARHIIYVSNHNSNIFPV